MRSKLWIFALGASLCSFSATAAGPQPYPGALMDTPATKTTPPAAFVRLGKPVVAFEHTTMADVVALTGAKPVTEGRGMFRRDYVCLAGSENGRPMRLWLIATDGAAISEAQLEWADTPEAACTPLPKALLPVRLGKVGLGMTEKDLRGFQGAPSHTVENGWRFWFGQRWLRDERNFQKLELNWLGARVKRGRVDRLFASQVTNP